MAEDKKGFVLYADLIHTVNKMPNDKAGELLKHILSYVNDEEPTTDDLIVQLTFEPIKQQLKRDLKKYEQIKIKRSEAGKESARLRALKKEEQKQQKATSVESVEQDLTNSTVRDTVKVTVKDTVIVKDINNSLYYKSEKEFLEDWNKARVSILKVKASNISKLSNQEHTDFNLIKRGFTIEDFKNGIRGLLKQKDMFASNTLRPKHFLSDMNIEKYIDAHANNKQLYETKNKYDVKL